MRKVDGTEALARVRQLRRASTEAENLLWSRLRGRRYEACKFRRQVWIGPFVVDFLCQEAKLVIELDGAQHSEAVAYDEARSRFLAQEGFKVLRFWNNGVATDLDSVLAAIRVELLRRVPSPSHSASPRGPLPLP
jgi:very-short-patch-repair endonuclease